MSLSNLEKFLHSRYGEGGARSEGVFTLSREKAIEKLAGFRLPYKGAWILKLVQAGVASASCREISIRLGRRVTTVHYQGLTGWTPQMVEDALLDPSLTRSRALDHLVIGLGSVGFEEGRAFWVEFSTSEEALTWSGETLIRAPGERADGVAVTITGTASGDESGLLGWSRGRNISSRNADAATSLTRKAHLCPIPLRLDGRRIDALELDFHHGWGGGSQLLSISFEEADLPALSFPLATSGGAEKAGKPVDPTLLTATEKARGGVTTGPPASQLPVLIAAHLKGSTSKHVEWSIKASHSLCNWVRDGVVVESEVLSEMKAPCSAGCFVSADGLRSDLTTFGVVGGEEKSRRRHEARRAIGLAVARLGEIDLERLDEIARTQGKKALIGFTVLGVGLLPINPAVGGLFVGASLLSLMLDKKKYPWGEQVRSGLRRLAATFPPPGAEEAGPH